MQERVGGTPPNGIAIAGAVLAGIAGLLWAAAPDLAFVIVALPALLGLALSGTALWSAATLPAGAGRPSRVPALLLGATGAVVDLAAIAWSAGLWLAFLG